MMQIQQRTETIHVQMYTFDLTEAEALNVCADPSDFQADLRRALNVNAAPAASSPRKIGGGNTKKASNGKQPHAPAKAACPHCSRTIAVQFLPRHIRTSHPEFAATAN